MKVDFIFRKLLNRVGGIGKEFFKVGKAYSFKLASINLLWWLTYYCRLKSLNIKLESAKQCELNKMIESKYPHIIDRYKNNCESTVPIKSFRLWIFWAQGLDNMPFLVKRCYEQMKELWGSQLVLLDLHNVRDYVEIPNYVYCNAGGGAICAL